MTERISSRSTRVSDYVAARKPFNTHGALRAESGRVSLAWGHRLPRKYDESVKRATYVVYSYATPIAWWSEDDGWTMPDVRYSVTTSKHQGATGLRTMERINR